MSGIAGIFNLDGKPAERGDIVRMLGSMRRRGPDGLQYWTGNNVGLGHAMLHTTPESLHENQPVESPCGRFVLTADARVDNREELVRKLEPVRQENGIATDADLLLEAYRRWGRGLGEHVIGDYAIAIWDSHERRIVCIRDHAGIKPFFYVHLPGRMFAFASDVRALLCLPDVPRRLNKERVADYLINIWSNASYTFFQAIKRVPAAHSLAVNRDDLSIKRYWELDPEYELELRSSRDYEEAFREQFTEAVRCRLRSAKPVGAMLSGGLDSTAVVGTARSIFHEVGIDRLPVYSIVFDESKSCDERPYIRRMIDGGGLDWHTVQGDHPDHLPISGRRDLMQAYGQPFSAPNAVQYDRLCRAIRENGTTVILDGHGGDEAISYGHGRYGELALDGAWSALFLEAVMERRRGGEPPMSVFDHYVRYARSVRARPPRGYLRLRRVLHRSQKASDDRPMPETQLLERDFGIETNVDERFRQWEEREPTYVHGDRAKQWKILSGIRQPIVFDELSSVVSYHGLEGRYPFWDRRVIEYCLSVPSREKLRYGRSRRLLRRAMRGYVPGPILRRHDKTFFTASIHAAIAGRDADSLHSIGDSLKSVESIVNIPWVHSCVRNIQDGSALPPDIFRLLRGLTLALWYEHVAQSPNKLDAKVVSDQCC